MKPKIIEFLKSYGLKNFMARLLAAYFFVSSVGIFISQKSGVSPNGSWKDFVGAQGLLATLLWTLAAFLALSVLYRLISPKTDAIALMAGAILFCASAVFGSGSFYLGAAAGIIAAIFTAYSAEKLGGERVSSKTAAVITAVSAVTVFLFVAMTTVAHHRNFGTPCFDMGIFVQTFHSLKEHFNAVITCERGQFMSHFRVHTSFIFYLFLPIYALFPKPETLLIGQAFFAMSGVLPLYFIAKKRGFKGMSLAAVCSVYIFYGGLILPCYYSFHENAFLPTLLMWLFFAMERKNIPLFYVMSALVCSVKEDAPLYVFCAAVFFAIAEKSKKRLHGVIAAGLSAVYFAIVMKFLASGGDGQYMTASRFGELMVTNSEGIIGVIRNSLTDPAYLVSLLLTEKTLLFFVETMLPLAFLPFMTLKLERYLLFVPYAVMNLIIGAGYAYAGDIGFQYIFGPACFLIYLSVLNLGDLGPKFSRRILPAMAVFGFVLAVATVSPKLSYINESIEKADYYASAEECIESVPSDASVLANAFILPHAANRDEIYELLSDTLIRDAWGNVSGLKGEEKYDYCILSRLDPLTDELMPLLEKLGWRLCADSDSFVFVMGRGEN